MVLVTPGEPADRPDLLNAEAGEVLITHSPVGFIGMISTSTVMNGIRHNA